MSDEPGAFVIFGITMIGIALDVWHVWRRIARLEARIDKLEGERRQGAEAQVQR